MTENNSRREFIKHVSASAALLAASNAVAAQTINNEQTSMDDAAQDASVTGPAAMSGGIPRRPLGRTGVEVSALGLGGAHLGGIKTETEAIRIVHEAIDSGVTFMDNAWEYNKGRSEDWMGKALKDRRDKVFLMTKVCTHGRDKKVAMQQLNESLRRLQTDYVDLWQVHECVYDNDPERHFMQGGVIEALTEAKKSGKVRFVGFTGHKDPAIHLEMLRRNYPFDTCQLPLNPFDATFRSFEQQVLPELTRRGIAPLAMKTMGGEGYPIKHGALTPAEALRYALSLPVATVVFGYDSLEMVRENIKTAREFKQMTAAEMTALRERNREYAADGRFELYKTSKKFDADEGRRQHGFPTQKEVAI